jgi:cysteine desulfurase
MHGGEQESGRRASTHNVPGIVGLGKAAGIAQQELAEEAERVGRFRDRLIKGILENVEHARLNGHPQVRLPNNVNVSISYAEGESMCLNLDQEGICCSTGSACTSAITEPSHVLLALGLNPLQAHSSLRFSMGKWTTEEEIDMVLDVLPRIVAKLRAMSPLLKNSR